ncbi:uncharacterized protein LOC131312699 [Rhododendron vialii]|uniref:uncharacterized protein LOC131312699 n=1 Tax=Rhododendron vialii TaxID=182163 RepID=UPI00265EE04B|nr:uncharacterized protein LOC131312699 [Rhododendron vialii]
MDSSQPRNHSAHHHHHCPHQPPHHHHHYHLHFSPHCPLHSRLLQPNIHLHPCPSSLPSLNQSKSLVPECAETYPSDALMIQDQEGNEEAFEEVDEDPVFILTDEWREFFAKSEAKRRLAKKQARKKGKASAV